MDMVEDQCSTRGPSLSGLRCSTAGSSAGSSLPPKEKVASKIADVGQLLRSLNSAMEFNEEKDRQWLRWVVSKEHHAFATLLKILLDERYASFLDLQCVTLQAVRLMLSIMKRMCVVHSVDIGLRCFNELASADPKIQHEEVIQLIVQKALGYQEPSEACEAMLVVSELGMCQAALPRLPELFVEVPSRAENLVDAVLVAYTRPELRAPLVEAVVATEGGKVIGEVLVRVINRAPDEKRRLRALEVITECVKRNSEYLYTNDARILIEILLREMPKYACDTQKDASNIRKGFLCHVECLKAVVKRCPSARAHRRSDVLQMLEDLQSDDGLLLDIRAKSAEVVPWVRDDQAAASMVGGG